MDSSYALNTASSSMSIVVMLIFTVACIIGTWKVYEKADEAGWKAIIPFYNSYILFKITWGNGWLFLLLIVPVVNIVIQIITMVKLSKVFGHGGGFACGLIFLNYVFLLILGFDRSTYKGVQ